MKIKIDLPGWNSYTGLLSNVPFVDGVSERDVTEREAAMIGANLRVVRIDTEEQVGATTIKVGNIPAAPITYADKTPDPVKEKVEVVTEVKAPETEVKKYTKEELEEIADKSGIKGIRDIAKEYDVKGVQISQLIEGILQAQGK